MVSILITVFEVSWIPFFVISVILVQNKNIYNNDFVAFKNEGTMLRTISLLLSHFSYTMNPIICVAFNKDFRSYVKKISCLILSRKRYKVSTHKTSPIHLANEPKMGRFNIKVNKRKMAETTL